VDHNPRFINKLDSKKLQDFYSEAYANGHILNNSSHHDWQFKNNPENNFNTKSIIITENNKEISSHFGLIPISLKVFNDIKFSCCFISVFTLTRHRKKSLADKLVKYAFKFFDAVMVLSYSEEVLRIYEKNGFNSCGELNRHVGILNKKRLEDFLVQKIPKDCLESKGEMELNRISKLNDDYDVFWDHVKDQFPITVNRTKRYLTWRYLDHPLIDYHFMALNKNNKMVGYCVIRFEDKNEVLTACRIIDLVIKQGYEDELIQQIINYCYDKADFIDFFCTGNFYEEALTRKNFFNNLSSDFLIPSTFNPIDLNRKPSINFVYKDINLKLNKEQKDDPNLWYCVKGDSDQDRAF
jgi:hypothetical protein